MCGWLNTPLIMCNTCLCMVAMAMTWCLQAYQNLWSSVHSISDSVLSNRVTKLPYSLFPKKQKRNSIPFPSFDLAWNPDSPFRVCLATLETNFLQMLDNKIQKGKKAWVWSYVPPSHKEMDLVTHPQFSFCFPKSWEGSGVLIILSPYLSLSWGTIGWPYSLASFLGHSQIFSSSCEENLIFSTAAEWKSGSGPRNKAIYNPRTWHFLGSMTKCGNPFFPACVTESNLELSLGLGLKLGTMLGTFISWWYQNSS